MRNSLINTAKVNSKPLTLKILVIDCISMISKKFYNFLEDTNNVNFLIS